MWDSISGQETLTLKGRAGIVSSAAFRPDGKQIAGGGRDNTRKGELTVWDASKGPETSR